MGAEAIRRVEHLVDREDGRLGELAAGLLERHGYRLAADGHGPHLNVLGHPLIELPVWVAGDGARRVPADALADICESGLCGYLSVRAEDDLFDGDVDDPGGALMVSSFFRTRHQALLARWVTDPRFWVRFEAVWSSYAQAMLEERELHNPATDYGADQFELVLGRSQPLEIPGDAVLSLTGRWDDSELFGSLVRQLTLATQLVDDFVDAISDRATGNYTLMVRRLGGLEGERALRIGMISSWDQVQEEAATALSGAVDVAQTLGIFQLATWVEERQRVISRATDRMYRALFDGMASK